MNNRLLLLLLILIALIAAGCASPSDKPPSSVKILGSDGDVRLPVEAADSGEERTLGLMWREHLDSDKGMLFMFDDEGYHSFWMKNTLIPLDMIFISGNSTIVDIKEGLQPCTVEDCEIYVPSGRAKYVLEVNAGFVKEKNIKTGDKVII